MAAVERSPSDRIVRTPAGDAGGYTAARNFESLYPELRRMAHARLRRSEPLTLLDTTALVHESYLRLDKLGSVCPADRGRFLAYAARTMRSVIVDLLRSRSADKHGGGLDHVALDTAGAENLAAVDDSVIRVSEAIEELACVDARAAQVVEMRYFAGMRDPEIADALGVTERTVGRDWRKARMLLHAVLS